MANEINTNMETLTIRIDQVVESVEDLKNQDGDESDNEDFGTPGNRNATVVTAQQETDECLSVNVLTTVDPFASQLPAYSVENALDAIREKLDSPQRKEMTKRALMTCRQRESETVREFMARLSPLVSTVCAGQRHRAYDCRDRRAGFQGAGAPNSYPVGRAPYYAPVNMVQPCYPHQINETGQSSSSQNLGVDVGALAEQLIQRMKITESPAPSHFSPADFVDVHSLRSDILMFLFPSEGEFILPIFSNTALRRGHVE
uniref:Uncharacterized protein n=1 Tax=Globodera rostochiensis TaxID=31243 RepID=A0A914HQR3_GLORO